MARLPAPPPPKGDPRFDDWMREMWPLLRALIEGTEATPDTLTQAQASELVGGGSTSMHYHAADRARANHTGTQTSSTISDFVPAVQALISVGGGHPALSGLAWTSSGHVATASTVAGFGTSGEAVELTRTGTGTVVVMQQAPTLNGNVNISAGILNLDDGNAIAWGGGSARPAWLGNKASGYLASFIAGTEVTRITADGFGVGIAPVDKFNVSVGAGGNAGRIVYTDATTANGGLFGWYENTTLYGFINQRGSTHADAGQWNIGNNVGAVALFAGGAERVRITAAGALTLYADQPIGRNVDTSVLVLQGGSTVSDGGQILLYGNDNGTFPGQFKITAQDSTGFTLAGTPAGSLSWSGGTVDFSTADVTTDNLTVNGNTVIGNASTDTLTVNPNTVTWQNAPTHSNDHTFSGNISAANLTSGSYTPTRANIANVSSSTANAAYWLRLGNLVFVFGTVDVDPTSAGSLTTITLTLPPVSADLSTATELVGTCCHDQGDNSAGWVTGRAASDVAELNFVAQSGTTGTLHYNYAFQI